MTAVVVAGCARATSAEPAPWIDEDDRLQRTVSERLGSIKYSRVSDLVTCCLFVRPFILAILMLSLCYSTCLVLTANLRAQKTLVLQEQGESIWMFCLGCAVQWCSTGCCNLASAQGHQLLCHCRLLSRLDMYGLCEVSVHGDGNCQVSIQFVCFCTMQSFPSMQLCRACSIQPWQYTPICSSVLFQTSCTGHRMSTAIYVQQP